MPVSVVANSTLLPTGIVPSVLVVDAVTRTSPAAVAIRSQEFLYVPLYPSPTAATIPRTRTRARWVAASFNRTRDLIIGNSGADMAFPFRPRDGPGCLGR